MATRIVDLSNVAPENIGAYQQKYGGDSNTNIIMPSSSSSSSNYSTGSSSSSNTSSSNTPARTYSTGAASSNLPDTTNAAALTPKSIWDNFVNAITGKGINTTQNVNATTEIPPLLRKPTAVVTPIEATKEVNNAKEIVNKVNEKINTKPIISGYNAMSPVEYSYDPVTGIQTPTGRVWKKPEEKKVVEPAGKTAEEIQADLILNDGKVEMYNEATGQKELVDSNTPGYSRVNPADKNAIETAVVDNDVYKNFGDGKFGKVDGTGNYSQITEAAFENAKNMEGIVKQKNDILNGDFELPASQKAQIDAFTAQYQSIIRAQERENANTTGATTIAMNRYGLGDQLVGAGIITGVINDGLAKVADLQSKLAAGVAEMTQGFLNDDYDRLQNAYTDYKNNQKELQDKIDKTQEAVKEANKILKEQELDKLIADLFSSGITDPIEIMKEAAKKGKVVTSEQVGKTLNVIEKSSADAEKKQQDVWNAAQALGDYRTAAEVMALDPRSPTFADDLNRLQGGLRAKATEAEKDSYDASNTYNILNNSVDKNGYVEPAVFLKLRANSRMSTSEFNAKFGHFIYKDSKGLVGLADNSGSFELTPTFKTELIKNGVDLDAYQTDPEYRKAVNSKLE